MQRQAEPNNPRAGNHAVNGFSLIELLVVVAVILIIAAIAIPNYIHSRMRANEASAIQSLRNISTAQALYSTMWSGRLRRLVCKASLAMAWSSIRITRR